MISLNLDRNNPTPLFKQIQAQLQDMMDRGVLPPGFRMPSTRELSEKMAVNRSTVYKAYEELWALGYLESRPGSYSYVRKKRETAARETDSRQGKINWQEKVAPQINEIRDFSEATMEKMKPGMRPGVIDMATLVPDPRLQPAEDFRQCMNRVLREKGAGALEYSEPLGYLPLRKYIARRMQRHGIRASADEILITNGCQNAIDLSLRMLTQPGSPVVVESPTYHTVLPLLHYYKTRTIPIPMEPDGLDLDTLRREMKIERPALVYTIPNFHNPTGICSSQAHREELLALCEKHRVPLVEDAFEDEMNYFGKVPLSIKSMDSGKVVIYLGTFSKVLFPGIRVGWVAAERECTGPLAALKQYTDLSSNLPVQVALSEFCHRGYYELHLKKLHREYRKRLHITLKALKTHLDIPGVTWTEPTGGYLVWVELKGWRIAEEELLQSFFKNGVAVAPGSMFYDKIEDIPHPSFRLSISALQEGEIEEGILRLGKSLTAIAPRVRTGG